MPTQSAASTPHQRKLRKRRILFIVLGVLLVGLIAFRLYLPTLVKNTLNKQLADLGGYTGRVYDVDIRLIRGAYVIDSFRIDKKSGNIPVPFFSVDKIDLSISWRDLFKGHLVSEIEMYTPKLNFVKGPTEAQSQGGGDAPSWTETVKGLFPIKIGQLAIHNGQIHYRDFHTQPKVDVYLDSFNASVTNLTNSEEISDNLFAKLEGQGRLMGTSALVLRGSINPYEQQPTFDVNAKLDNMDLRTLNGILRAYTKIDVEKGQFGLYTEVAAAKGGFAGYAKPVFTDLQVLDLKEDSKKGIAVLWEAAVGAVTTIFQNHPKDRFASRIPFKGTFEDVNVDVWSAIGSILRNTFLEALIPQLDQSIGIDDAAEAVKDGKDPKDRKKEARKKEREQRRAKRKQAQAADKKD